MQKKNYFKIIIAVIAILLIQFIYFNYVATSNTGEIQKANAQIESLHETIAELNTQLESSSRKSFVNSHQIPAKIAFCDDTLDMKNQLFRERLEREFYSLLNKQGQIQLYLKRSIKYTEMIERYLKKNDLPLDLKYLAIHESALLPGIKSRSNAVGLWQFMRATGRLYGLKINRFIDERRDPEMATRAAMRFIKEMYRYYENWPLVMAAYNGGHGRVSRAVKDQNSDSFFDLSLPEETERYYFKIVATKLLLSNAEKYGFYLEEKDLFTPIPTIMIQYQIKEDRISVEEICKQYKLSQAEFKYFNPKIIGSYLPRGKYEFNIPEEKYKSIVLESGSENIGNISDEDILPYKNSGASSGN
jgi:membrane-bound lytic murein transglycosylase D